MGGDGEEIGLPCGDVALGLGRRVHVPGGHGGEREGADERLEVFGVQAILERAPRVVDHAAGRPSGTGQTW